MTSELKSLGDKSGSGSFQYHIFDPRQGSANQPHLLNRLYEEWKRGWQKTYSELNSQSTPEPDDFIRQSLAVGIFSSKGELAALHTYSHFDLEQTSHREHPYFEIYPRETLQELRDRGQSRVLTMEYLLANPKYRRSLSGVSFAEVVVRLGLCLFRESDADICITVTRNNRRVNEMCHRLGCTTLHEGLELHQVEVDIISFFKDRLELGGSVPEALVSEKLWNHRFDHTNNGDVPSTKRAEGI